MKTQLFQDGEQASLAGLSVAANKFGNATNDQLRRHGADPEKMALAESDFIHYGRKLINAIEEHVKKFHPSETKNLSAVDSGVDDSALPPSLRGNPMAEAAMALGLIK